MAEVGVGLIGLGTVGSVVARRLIDEWQLLAARAGVTPVLRRVAVRDPGRARDVDLRNAILGGSAEQLIDDPAVELVVELMGGVDHASALIERALRAGKPVVTANKAVLAAHGIDLARLAVAHGVSLRYEAAVAAALPVVTMLRESLRGDRIRAVEGIVNGTTNLILTRMESGGLDFSEALREAQERGFAEADPSADVDGDDSAAKLVLLGRLAFDAALERQDVEVVGIGGVDATDIACADAMDGSVKLIALACRDGEGVALSVRPTVVVAGHPLYGVDAAENGVVIEADLAGTIVVRGQGAGGDATASAVVSDIVQTAGDRSADAAAPAATARPLEGSAVERGGYVRVELTAIEDADRLVTQALEDRGIPIRALTTIAAPDGRPAQLAVLTAVLPRAMLERAVETLDSLPAVRAVATVMDCTGVD